MDIKQYMQQVGAQARSAAAVCAAASTAQKNQALQLMAGQIDAARKHLLAENEKDMQAGAQSGLDSALLDRLELNESRIDAMIEGLHQVSSLDDPVGKIRELVVRPSGIQVGRMRVPLGVIGIIYESRPNVTVEAAALCLKSGNAAILRGGSEAIHSNQAIGACVQEAMKGAGMPEHTVQVLETTDRAAVGELITMDEFVDVIVPRGGKGLIERISREASVTVIKHLDGNCHVYLDADADTAMALDIAVNSKTQRYGTCNTAESLLVHRNRAEQLLPQIAALLSEHKVELRVCDRTAAILASASLADIRVLPATEQDWYEEYLAPVLSVKVVDSLDRAIKHINKYSSAHTETIVTDNHRAAMRFLREVDSSSVLINASTRFADGFEYGLGAEIGISTDKIHARGPVGLEGLTCEKFVVFGNGQTRH